MDEKQDSTSSDDLMNASFRALSQVPKSVMQAYQEPTLLRDLPRVAQAADADVLIQEQIDFIANATDKIRPDGLTISLENKEETEIRYVKGDGPDVWPHLIAWRSEGRADVLGRLGQSVPGNFLRSRDVPVTVHPTWAAFCEQVWQPAGIAEFAFSEFSVPLRQTKRLAFSYGYYDCSNVDNVATRFEFDFLTTPFTIAWLFRMDVIDAETMHEWLRLLSGLTPAKLFLIREIVCSTRYQSTVTLTQMGLSKRNLENHLYQLSEVLDEKVPKQLNQKGYGSTLVDIANTYGFLSFAGRPRFSIPLDDLASALERES